MKRLTRDCKTDYSVRKGNYADYSVILWQITPLDIVTTDYSVRQCDYGLLCYTGFLWQITLLNGVTMADYSVRQGDCGRLLC